jgi:exonuclease III
MALRILSYNILAGGEDRIPLIANVIHKHQPDVVALLEARSRSNAEALAKQLGMSLTLGESTNINKDHVAWLSRLPIMRDENNRLPALAKTLVEIKFLWDGNHIALFEKYLKTRQNQEREHYRVTEMHAILEILHSHRNHLHALVGDLNTVHPSDHPNISAYIATLKAKGEQSPNPQFPREVIPLLLKAKYVDCYRTIHPTASGYTYKLPTLALRLDYIFASPKLAKYLHACEIVIEGDAEAASDHLPIWSEFM